MFIVWFAIFGLVVGAMARLLVPGKDNMSVLGTMALGIVGSIVGSLIVRIFTNRAGIGFIGAVIFTVLTLLVYRNMVGKRTV